MKCVPLSNLTQDFPSYMWNVDAFVQVLEENLTWEEVQWASTSVWVRGTEYVLTRAQFYSFDKDDMKE